jgi:DNA-binding transcriptional MerR regulator
LEQLAERAARALVDAEVRVANGRVTGVPDGRLIRWYTTIGLLDRPVIGPGRVAQYGPRHLLQLVAVKRLQAQGAPLAEIQLRLAGATDSTLQRIAALPAGLDDPDPDGTMADREMFGPTRSAHRPAARSTVSPDAGANKTPRFWAARPAATVSDRPVDSAADSAGELELRGTSSDSGPAHADDVLRVYGVRLDALTLLLPAEPQQSDIDEIAAAARPLLDLLASRGLLNPTEGASS